jgi:hypothetical protein
MRITELATALVALGLPAMAAAQSAQGDVSVTIYNNDRALIQDTRRINFPAGRSRQEFPDVSAQIQPETVTLTAADTGIIEQNFDYDLLTPAKLLDKAVGQTVTVVRVNPATGAETREVAQVLANNGGTVLKIGTRIEVLGDLGARVVFSSLPPNLRARPTLSVTLGSDHAGLRPVTLSYLTRGLGWSADYVALFDENSGKIDVQGWITLTNSSGTTFENARTLLVAGEVGANANGTSRPQTRPSGNRPGTRTADRERLGDFYVYPINGRTTIANAQKKQVSFLDVKGASATKGYFYSNDWLEKASDPESVDTVLRFSSSKGSGLGDALPAGTVRIYMRDARGQPQFIGENDIDHSPMGSDIAIKTGEAFDVKVLPVLEKREVIPSDEWERSERYRVTRDGDVKEVIVDSAVTYWRTSMSYKVTNAKPRPVTVELVQAGLDRGWHDTRVPSESIQGTQRSRDERMWMVEVPANSEATLTAQFDTRY